MTLIVGEALNRRSDLQKRIAQLQDRVSACVLAQEGEEPPESPDELLAELAARCDELEGLIAKINHTNANARLASGETVTEGLARRDVIALRQNALRTAIKAATGDSLGGGFGLARYSRSEIRMVRQVKVRELQDSAHSAPWIGHHLTLT
ncbi:MAG TPA: DIP1984 family protein [Solirubrobacteraceae bacterium]|nr:DIP1984 family protein [Solirubrobacteraceae bacterium]